MSNRAPQFRVGQQQAVTPQMQQAFRLLQLPAPALQAQLQQALEHNVMLEADEAFDATWALECSPDADEAGSREAGGATEWLGAGDSTLREHLAWQLELAPLPNGPRAIGRALIAAIDDDGFLTESPQAIAAAVSGAVRAESGVVESVLAIVQQFDPLGVAARSVPECLDLQLAQLEQGTPGLDAARRIARHHLDLADAQQVTDLARLTGCGGADLEAALALVRSCHRRPGAAFEALRAEYVVPDVYARRAGEGWSVELNPAATPRLRVNERYAGMVTRSADHAMLRAQLQEARWLVGSLEIRNDTVLRLARAIVYRQKAFLDRSADSMRPILPREAAESVELPESALARVSAGKYLHTPRGVFEFRFFLAGRDRVQPAA